MSAVNMLTVAQVEAVVSSEATNTVTNISLLKYYMPFYISPPSLFNNRRLKRKRRQWAQNQFNNKSKNKKTESEPTLTINLLSDDEEEEQKVKCVQQMNITAVKQKNIKYMHTHPELMVQDNQRQLLQNLYLNPILLKTLSSNEPPPLVPLSTPATVTKVNNNINFNMQQSMLFYHQQQQNKLSFLTVPQLINPHTLLHGTKTSDNTKKKQRKKRKANVTPVLLNTESIVVSDDSDPEFIRTPVKNNNNTMTMLPKSPVISLLPELTLTAINNNSSNNNNNNNSMDKKSPQPLLSHANEEEVTVSLVPRHTKTNAHSKPITQEKPSTLHKNDVFPMLPDETTVHTVIANRTYELSLTKLREGLAQGEQTSPTTKDTIAPHESSKTSPISLKLSNDLSISLISDEEEDSQECLSDNERARLSAELLRRQQPQLSVQQVNLSASSSKQPPKRRKLG